MNRQPSAHEFDEVSLMEFTDKAELIQKLKKAKKRDEITYPRILDRMEANGKFVSLTTLRRVFADGSESNAASFNLENTLMPIAEAILEVEDSPSQEATIYAKEIDGLKAVIRVQNEEIVKLHDINEHLESRVTFLVEQIEKKDAIIQKLLEKVL